MIMIVVIFFFFLFSQPVQRVFNLLTVHGGENTPQQVQLCVVFMHLVEQWFLYLMTWETIFQTWTLTVLIYSKYNLNLN